MFQNSIQLNRHEKVAAENVYKALGIFHTESVVDFKANMPE